MGIKYERTKTNRHATKVPALQSRVASSINLLAEELSYLQVTLLEQTTKGKEQCTRWNYTLKIMKKF